MPVGPAHVVYYVTLVTAGRECLFGHVEPAGTVSLSEYGWMIRREWLRNGFVRPEVELDAYVIMPNHLHGIVAVAAAGEEHAGARTDRVAEQVAVARAPRPAVTPAPRPALVAGSAPGRLLGAVLAGFKAMCTVQINHRRGRPGAPVWQRGYVERVVRSQGELELLRHHVAGNPARWLTRAGPDR